MKEEKNECDANPEKYWKQYWKRVIPHPVHLRDIQLYESTKVDEEGVKEATFLQNPTKNDKS